MIKKILILVMAMLLITSVIAGSALASSSFDIQSLDGKFITFQDGSFSFTAGPNFSVNSSLPENSMEGLTGALDGTFAIGAITPLGAGEIAPVTGSGTMTIYDGGLLFTSSVTWVDITTLGNIGGINVFGAANLGGFNYGGINADLLAFSQAPAGIGNITFQFAPLGFTLSQLEASLTPISTSFSGSYAAVPLPPSALLLGSGLLGMLGLAWRTRKS